jgi:hypothetical protein
MATTKRVAIPMGVGQWGSTGEVLNIPFDSSGILTLDKLQKNSIKLMVIAPVVCFVCLFLNSFHKDLIGVTQPVNKFNAFLNTILISTVSRPQIVKVGASNA